MKADLASLCRGKAWEMLPWLAALAYLAYLHYHLQFSGDDLLFGKYEADFSFWSWRYATWSSRLLTETILVSLLHLPVLVWKIGDVLIALAMLVCISYLVVPSRDKVLGNWLLVLSFMLYPFECMSSAGNVATTLNYLWPMAFCLLSLVPVKLMIEGQEVHPLVAGLGIFFLILAGDVEQCCMILVLLLGGLALLYREKAARVLGKYKALWSLYALVILASLLKISFCPGNSVRYLLESARFFPDFDRLSLVEKFHLFILDITAYIITYDVTLLLLSAVLLYVVVRKYRSFFFHLLAAIPLVISLAMVAGNHLLHMWHIEQVRNILELQHGIGVLTFANPKLYVLFWAGGILFIFLFCALYLAFHGTGQQRFLLLVFLIGFGTAAVLMFSPTIFASSYRVFFHFSIAAMVLLVRSVLYAVRM